MLCGTKAITNNKFLPKLPKTRSSSGGVVYFFLLLIIDQQPTKISGNEIHFNKLRVAQSRLKEVMN